MTAPAPATPPVQTCWTCAHAIFSERGTYCWIYQLNIISEVLDGAECPVYEFSEDTP